MRTFATRIGSKPGSKPQGYSSLRSAPILAPAPHQSESSAEREATQTAVRVMNTQPSLRESSAPREATGRLPGCTPQNRILPTAGQPLDSATRSSMESRFHYDFSRVRIHHDATAQQAASSLNARAFTHGRDIAFAKGQYAPTTAEGQHLLAHELAHTIQQAQTSFPIIRRSPEIHGGQTFDKDDAGNIDQAIAASPIKNYLKPEQIRPLKGNFDLRSPTDFAKDFKKWGKSSEAASNIGGFVDRSGKQPRIKLRDRSTDEKTDPPSTVEAAIHETVHLNSNTGFANQFGPPLNEGVTEYFTEKVMKRPGRDDREQVNFANGFIDALGNGGEDRTARAYFLKGEAGALYRSIAAAFQANKGVDFNKWMTSLRSEKSDDWSDSNKILSRTMSHPAAPATTTTPAPSAKAPAPDPVPPATAPATKPAVPATTKIE